MSCREGESGGFKDSKGVKGRMRIQRYVVGGFKGSRGIQEE